MFLCVFGFDIWDLRFGVSWLHYLVWNCRLCGCVCVAVIAICCFCDCLGGLSCARGGLAYRVAVLVRYVHGLCVLLVCLVFNYVWLIAGNANSVVV